MNNLLRRKVPASEDFSLRLTLGVVYGSVCLNESACEPPPEARHLQAGCPSYPEVSSRRLFRGSPGLKAG